MPTVFMVQRSICKWRIETEKGFILQDDITLEDFRAEEYVRNYVSSWSGWQYEMRPLPRKVK